MPYWSRCCRCEQGMTFSLVCVGFCYFSKFRTFQLWVYNFRFTMTVVEANKYLQKKKRKISSKVKLPGLKTNATRKEDN